MPSELIHPASYAKGEVRLHSVFPVGRSTGKSTWQMHPCPPGEPQGFNHWSQRTDWQPNQFLYEWGTIFANMLLRRGANFGIGGMYLEFENTGSPGDPVSPPDFTRDPQEGVNYYNGLSDSADRDYLRVPLVAGTLASSELAKFPYGNQPSFFAQTSGTAGVHGKPFSDANNSTVFGGALVSFLDETDYTRDLVLSRFYVTVEKQMVKLPTSQIGFEWRLTFQ